MLNPSRNPLGHQEDAWNLGSKAAAAKAVMGPTPQYLAPQPYGESHWFIKQIEVPPIPDTES